jgi:hypothetical protein
MANSISPTAPRRQQIRSAHHTRADWSTIASLATAGGTLVLGVATFSSVRASQRAAQIAEQALLIGLRPILALARENDPAMTVGFADRRSVHVAGGMAAVELDEGRVYFVVPLHNVGSGIAVLHSWRLIPEHRPGGEPDLSTFRRQTRDIFMPAGEVGFWRAALRDPDDEMRAGLDEAYAARSPLTVELLYGDHEGGQRAVTRFGLSPTDDGWLPGVSRHWRLDGVNPRD